MENREMALSWFNNLTDKERFIFANDFFPERVVTTLTGREIEHIWSEASTFYKIVAETISHITLSVFGTNFDVIASRDKKYQNRIYIQVGYIAACTKTGQLQPWKGGKHYLSEHMTEDEVVKKIYVAFEQCVKHEVMEGFKYDNIIVFNPHVHFKELLAISHNEIRRD